MLLAFVGIKHNARPLAVSKKVKERMKLGGSDVPARLGLKAAALAWLSTAPAFEICRPGQSCQRRLALARLWPEPRPVGVKFITNQI
jgi:hypothetical protein